MASKATISLAYVVAILPIFRLIAQKTSEVKDSLSIYVMSKVKSCFARARS